MNSNKKYTHVTTLFIFNAILWSSVHFCRWKVENSDNLEKLDIPSMPEDNGVNVSLAFWARREQHVEGKLINIP